MDISDKQFIEEAERAARKSKAGSTLGQVAIARGLYAVARAIEMLAKPPLQVVIAEEKLTKLGKDDRREAEARVRTCVHGLIYGFCTYCTTDESIPARTTCEATIPVGGVRYVCQVPAGRDRHPTDTMSRASIHKAQRQGGGFITWTP